MTRGVTTTMLVATLATSGFAQGVFRVAGRVVDETGSGLPHARVDVLQAGVVAATVQADYTGGFTSEPLGYGDYEVRASAPSFAVVSRTVSATAGTVVRIELILPLARLAERVEVAPTSIVGSRAELDRIPGSLDIVGRAELESSRVSATNEALRKVAGLHVREEEGFSLRPNIGVRGTNPTRSTRVLLLEDGIPLAYAPYGDNASYYHPPVERFDSIEVLKGAGQIVYGPMTVGGVINYLTPMPPARPMLKAVGTVGTRSYANGHVTYGARPGRVGVLLDYMRKQGNGSRENVHAALHDVNAKVVFTPWPQHLLTVRGNYYAEDSNITYSGLRQDEYARDPRQNPFANDFLYLDRFGGSATHAWAVRDNVLVSTNLYGSTFHRDWWRQSSNSAQRPNDAADPRCAGMANLFTTCGNEGRLREYVTWGLEPRVHVRSALSGLQAETDIGVRAHFEHQERRQENGNTPTARAGVLVENNQRLNDAYSGFVQQRLFLGPVTVTPGVRVERVSYARTNRLARSGQGVTGTTDLTQVIPGIGVAYTSAPAVTWFAGLHRGFAPPRTEDIIQNDTGGTVDLDSELSWNFEAGLRTTPARGVRVHATYFRMDYDNQIVPASVAGGIGATLTSAGETRHRGFELGGHVSTASLFNSPHDVRLQLAYTALPRAEFAGVRFSGVPQFQQVSVSGNRLPYAPEHLLTASAAYLHPAGMSVVLEATAVSRQFGDDLNTVAGTPDGQRGLIPGSTLWNLTANQRLGRRVTLFLTVKNLFDRTVIVDRSRGLLPGIPRLMHAGASLVF